jgi:tetratricopeptide (TPR) repeat protein
MVTAMSANSTERSSIINPADATLLGQLALQQLAARRLEPAELLINRIQRLDPDFGLGYWLEARLRLNAGLDATVSDCLQRGLCIAPALTEAVLDWSVRNAQLDFWSSAARWYQRAMVCGAASNVVLPQLGAAQCKSGDATSALETLDFAIRLDRLNVAAWTERALVLRSMERIDESLHAFDVSIILAPQNAQPWLDSALMLLSARRYRQAWYRHEFRWRTSQFNNPRAGIAALQTTRRVYRTDFDSMSCCLVWAEQGVGDEVMFGSMLGEFCGYVGKLLVQLDRRLIPLFKRSLPDDVEFFERGTVVPEDRYDSHIAIGSLGQYLRPTLESFEGKGGKYLWADPERIQAMREWLSVKEGERVIGLSWRSSNPETGAARSLALKDLVKSLQAPGVRFVNLQYGDVSAEIEALERDEGITVLQCPGLDTTDDLDGLAALIEACDEVVSIGNATAHLAGALGKKTTVLLPKAPSWRWLQSGAETPWYRSVLLDRTIA